MDINRLGKSLNARGAWINFRHPPYSIRRVLERTSLMAVGLGYGLLLLFNLQLPAEQRRQAQREDLNYAKAILRQSKDLILRADSVSASEKSIDPILLKRLLSDISSFHLLISMHPKGFEAGFVIPDVIGGINLGKVIASYGLQTYQGDAKYGPVLIDIDSVYYLIIKDEIELHGNTWNIYLVEDISRQIRQQEILAWVLILAALLASMVTLLLTRTAFDEVWSLCSALAA